MRNKPVVTVICPKCQGVISGCVFELRAFDEEWVKETRDYYQKGHKVELQEAREFYWCSCNAEKPAPQP